MGHPTAHDVGIDRRPVGHTLKTVEKRLEGTQIGLIALNCTRRITTVGSQISKKLADTVGR